jgi:MFS family permease
MTSTVLDLPTEERPPWLCRMPFYYGWVILLMAAWAMTATLPGRTHGLGLITKPLTDDPGLGVGEMLFSQLNFWAILLGSALCPPVGRFIDRFGVRRALVAVAVALGLAVLWMSQAAGAVTLFLSLTLVRGFGQGALSIVSMAMIGKWFTRRLGLAMGVFTVLLALGFIATTLGVGEAVKVHGWRPVWSWIGLSLLVGLAVPGWLLVRSSPESIGLDVEDAASISSNRSSLDLPLGAALRSPAFWCFTLAAAFFNLVWSAITLFNESILAERGFDHGDFILVMTVLVAAGLPANLVSGWLVTRWPIGRVLAFGMMLLAGALAAFPWLSTTTGAALYAAALGIAGGIITVVYFTAYGHAFGRTHLGAIQATVQMISVFASALGPVLLTTSKEATGSYQLLFHTAASVAAMLGVAAWFARLPRDRAVAGSW